MPAYRTTCLIDGFELLPIVLDPHSAPWFCMGCRRSWWVAELSEQARKQFRKPTEDFGFGDALAKLQTLIWEEHDLALKRGTSCREEMIPLIPLVGLEYMQRDGRIRPDFIKKLVIPEIARKGGGT